MIDTVVLTVPWGEYTIIEPDLFNPSAQPLMERIGNLYQGSRAVTACVQNPTPQDLRDENYKPRLTIRRRMVHGVFFTPLRVEFSVPKLLKGNNLYEVSDNDLNQSVELLESKLLQMGIAISKNRLLNASVSAVHFCKNIELTDGWTANYAIRQLNKLNFSKRLDHNHRHFKNDGQALYLHCGTHQIVFYDKMADLRQPAKRSLDYHQNDYQLNIFEDMPKELLRWEVRLTHKNKVLAVFKELGYSVDAVPFRMLFDQRLFRAVMAHYWRKLYQLETNVLFAQRKPSEMLERMSDGSKTIQVTLQTVGAALVAQDIGVRGLRIIVEGRSSTRTWYRIYDRLRQSLKHLNDVPKHDIISTIEQSIGLV